MVSALTIGRSGHVYMAFERLEPYNAKVLRTVLRGLGGGNAILATRQLLKANAFKKLPTYPQAQQPQQPFINKF